MSAQPQDERNSRRNVEIKLTRERYEKAKEIAGVAGGDGTVTSLLTAIVNDYIDHPEGEEDDGGHWHKEPL